MKAISSSTPLWAAAQPPIAALRLSRQVIGVDSDQTWIHLTLIRLCSDLVQVQISISSVQISVDLSSRSMDRSSRTSNSAARVSDQLQLVQQERRFYFVGRTDRRVIFSTAADSLDEAREKFRASGLSDSDALFIIKTETEICLA